MKKNASEMGRFFCFEILVQELLHIFIRVSATIGMNKLEETYHIERFLKTAHIDFDTFTKITNDPPDFELTIEKQKISIEHTRLIVCAGEEIRKHNLMVNKLISACQQSCDETLQFPIAVEINFDAKLDTTGKNFETRKLNIVEFIKLNVSKFENQDYDEFVANYSNLPEFVTSLKIIRYKGLVKSNWRTNGLIISGDIRDEEIIPVIEKKNNRMLETGYNIGYNENWLVLVAEGKKWSEFASYKPYGFRVNPNWKFDRIYVLSMFNDSVERLV
ncbi:MAG: hypothetical protein IPM77_13595 [Crocinitomicaceae bacterium]|nr:hypothetical protein [Crocinitomicaceae bacterium]